MKLRRYADVSGFVTSLKLHHSVGVHAAILLVAATLGGLLVSRLLLWAGLELPFVRFPIAVVAAYGLFLLFVDWWLAYIGLRRADGPEDPGIYPGEGTPDGHASMDAGGALKGGGGTFDGGGASASFDGTGASLEAKGTAAAVKGEVALRAKGAAAYAAVETKASAAATAAEAAAGGASAAEAAAGGASAAEAAVGGLSAGEAVTGLATLAEFALPVAIIVAVGGLLIVASGWIVGFTPLLLVETAAEVAIASGLIRSVAHKRSGEWLSSLFSRTAWRAGALAAGAAVIGLGVRMVDPSADTLGQAVSHWLGR